MPHLSSQRSRQLTNVDGLARTATETPKPCTGTPRAARSPKPPTCRFQFQRNPFIHLNLQFLPTMRPLVHHIHLLQSPINPLIRISQQSVCLMALAHNPWQEQFLNFSAQARRIPRTRVKRKRSSSHSRRYSRTPFLLTTTIPQL